MATGELCVLDKTGDTKLMWDSAVDDEVDAARRTFNDLKKKGYLAFSVTKKGDKGEVIKTFDPDAEKIIMAPPLVGG
jgi:hypothetical protein